MQQLENNSGNIHYDFNGKLVLPEKTHWFHAFVATLASLNKAVPNLHNRSFLANS